MNRNSRQVGLGVIGVASLLVSCLPAQSAVVYNSLSSFNAAIQGGAYVEDFESLTPGQADLGTFSKDFSNVGNTIQYTISTSDEIEYYVSQSTGGNQSFSTSITEYPVTVTFTTPNITAVGGNFFLLGFDENSANGTVSVTLNDGSTFSTNVTSHASGGLDYLGFTTTAPNFIQSITVGTAVNTYSGIDNLPVGFAAVPEPAVIASLSAAGLLGFGWLRRHHRRSERKS